MIRQFGRFASVGLLATLVHVTLALTAQTAIGIAPQGANLAGFCAAIAVSYFGHLHFSFHVTPRHVIHGPRFAVTALAGLALSSSITFAVVDGLGLPFSFAMLVVGATVPALNFFVLKLWTFTEAQERTGIGYLLTTLICATLLVLLWDRQINHDTAWYLFATQDWLNGAVLYGDIIEVNPPLNFYLTVPAVLLGEAAGFSLADAQYVVIAGLLFLSLYWVWSLLGAAESLSERQQMLLFLGAAGAAIVPFLTSIAQREQIMVILMLPWVVGKVVATPSGRNEAARAALAAIGICLKPYFVLYPILSTVLEIGHTRSLKPVFATANLAFLGVALGYLALAFALHPLYFTDIVPTASQIYGAYKFSSDVIVSVIWEVPVLACAAALCVGLAAGIAGRGLHYLAVFSLAALAIYLIQWTGYLYQFRPVLSFAILGCAWLLGNARPASLAGSVSVLALAALGYQGAANGFYSKPYPLTIAQEVSALGGSERLMAFTTSLPAGPGVAAALGADWASGYPALWLIPGAVNGLATTDCVEDIQACAAFQSLLDRTRDDVISDLETRNPDTIVFDHHGNFIEDRAFSWPGFIAEDPRLKSILDGFDLAHTGDTFQIYRRTDG